MYKLVRQYDEEQKNGGASLEEGKGAKGDVDNHGYIEVGGGGCIVMLLHSARDWNIPVGLAVTADWGGILIVYSHLSYTLIDWLIGMCNALNTLALVWQAAPASAFERVCIASC